MVTKRKPTTATTEAVERFVAGADATPKTAANEVTKPDPRSKVKHKAMTLPLNEYESELLAQAAAKTGRSQLGYVRFVMTQQAKADLGIED